MEDILNERKKTHGEFTDVAQVNVLLDHAVEDGVNWEKLPPMAQIAIKMILHKISRIVSGNWAFDDHWKDIIGYAQLVFDRILKRAAANDD